MVVAGFAQFQGAEGLPHGGQAAARHPAQDDVLLLGSAGLAAGVAAHDVRQPVELRRRQVAAHGFDVDQVVAVLPLGFYIGLPPAAVFRAAGGVGSSVVISAGICGRGQGRRRLPLDCLGSHQRTVVNGADVFQLGVHHIAEFVQADAVDQHLEARHHPVFAEQIGVVEHRPHGQGHPQIVVLRYPFVQGFRQAGHNGSPAAAEHFETLAPFPVNLPVLRHIG